MNTPAQTTESIKEALAAVVGKKNVLDDPDTLAQYSRDTSLQPPHMPDMVVRVTKTSEVQEVLKIASANNYPVVPRSSGTGTYGTGIPEEGGIILDLSGMNRVTRTDTRNRWVLIEAGVTFGQLEEELAKHGMQPLNTLLPRKDKSVITSVLEREPVLTAKTECDEPLRTMELVWGTGELLRTGSMCVDTIPPEEIPDKTNSDLCSTGGPGIDWWRLLTGCQGTFGVVTVMNVKIFHKPLKQKIVFLPFENLEDAVMPFYTIQKREIGHECFLLNGYDIAAILAENDSDIPELARTVPNYVIVLNLWGGQFFPEDRIAYEEKALNDIAEQYTFTPGETIKGVSEASLRLQKMLNRPWEGKVYWKERQSGGCLEVVFESGLDKVPSYWKLFKQIAGEHGIDTNNLGLYIQPRQRARVCHVEFHIPCDPDDAGSLEHVKAFHKKASEAVMNAGAFFYRPYYDWADMVYSRSGYTHEAIKKLKKILDPQNTLNPGKLAL
jgi:FAD/FMN-containing dehydrogenase